MCIYTYARVAGSVWYVVRRPSYFNNINEADLRGWRGAALCTAGGPRSGSGGGRRPVGVGVGGSGDVLYVCVYIWGDVTIYRKQQWTDNPRPMGVWIHIYMCVYKRECRQQHLTDEERGPPQTPTHPTINHSPTSKLAPTPTIRPSHTAVPINSPSSVAAAVGANTRAPVGVPDPAPAPAPALPLPAPCCRESRYPSQSARAEARRQRSASREVWPRGR